MPGATDTLLRCEGLRIRVPGRLLVDDLSLSLQRGELLAVLGQNGAGKTLTLMTLAGLRPPEHGRVSLLRADIHSTPRSSTAKHLALLLQDSDDIFPSTVLDTALIGRHPHIGRLRWESADDYAAARAALARVGLAEMAERDILTLSGGERRRLAIAQILAQSPDVYLLDEPTNHLDPQHQVDALRIFREAADDGAGIVACLHDVNLAARYADRCLLLFGDGRWRLGSNGEVLNEQSLSELFATGMEAIDWRGRKLFIASGHPAA